MKPRPFSGKWPNFLCRLFVVVILLQGISAQPASNQRVLSSPPDDRHLPSTHLERWPYPPRAQLQSPPSENNYLEKVPETNKSHYPVFVPYTIPIPWPTPFNGTNFAPVPYIRSQNPTLVEIPRDTDPIFILSPQFEFVPLYYYLPALQTIQQPSPLVKVTTAEKPAPKPTLPPKPSPEPQPISVPKKQQKPTSKPLYTSAPKPQQKPKTKPMKPLPSKPPQHPLDPACDHSIPPKGYVPPPKHTWTPPPENIPEYIPPSPSNLHTRSSESPDDKNGYDYVTYDPQYYTVSDDGVTYSPEIYTYSTDSNLRYDPYLKKHNGPSSYDQTAYVTYGPDTITFTEPTPDGDSYVTYGPDTVTYTEDSTYPERHYPAKSPQPPTPSKRPTYVTYGPDYVTYTEPAMYEGGYITEGPNTVTYTVDSSAPTPAKPTRPSQQSSGQPPYVTYGAETVTIIEPATDDDEYIIYGPNIDVYSEEAPVPPAQKRPTPAKSHRPSTRPPQPKRPHQVINTAPTTREDGYVTYESDVATHTEYALVPPPQKRPIPAKSPRPSTRPPPPDQPPYITYGPDQVIITEPTTREDGYVTYESDVATHTEDAPIPPSQKRPTPAKSPRPSIRPRPRPPPPDQPPHVTYRPDRVIITEPTTREDGYVTYDSEVATHTEDAPIPPSQKRPTPAKSPRPSTRPRPRPPPPDQPPYVTYRPDRVIITEPTTREDGYVTYESEIATRTEDAPVPPSQKRPIPAKSPRPSTPPRPHPPPDQPRYITYGPDQVIITKPTTREDGYVTYESEVATHTEDDPIPPSEKRPTSGKPQRPSKQPQASRPSPQSTTIDSRTSAFPIPEEPEEDEGGYVDYGPRYYTVVEQPTDEEVIYESHPSPQPTAIGSRSSAFPVPEEPEEDEGGYVDYGPRYYTVVEQPTGEEVIYESHPSTQPTAIGSRSSVFPVPKEPEENKAGYVYYGPKYYTVVEEPNGEKEVIYESEIMSIHEDEPHFEPPDEDPNFQYYEIEPEYDTYYEEDPGYKTYFEEEPQTEVQKNSPQRSNARIS